MSSCVLLEVKDGGIAHVILNRPGTYNSMNKEMFKRLASIIDELSTRKDVRLVLIRGAGGNFCSGLDLTDVMSNSSGAATLLDAWAPHEHNFAQHVCVGWRLLPFPVIAVIEGVCLGAGLQLALGADLRLSREDARFSVLEGKWGLIPDMGISVTARGTIREDVLRQLTFTAAIIPGSRAVALGLSTEAFATADALQSRVENLLKELLQRTPHALRLGKRLLWDPRGQWRWVGDDKRSTASTSADNSNKTPTSNPNTSVASTGSGAPAKHEWGSWLAGPDDYTRLSHEMKAQVQLLSGEQHKSLVRKVLGGQGKQAKL